MNRRSFIKTSAAIGAAATSVSIAGEKSEAIKSKPNVLIFFSDQQRADSLGCYGSPMNLTPNLDEMARDGILFENAFTTQPVCAPARSSLQTGKYPSSTGVFRNGLTLKDDEQTLANYFAGAGYDIGYIGKWHLAGTRTKPVPLERRGGYNDFWLASDVLEYTSKPYGGYLFDKDNKKVEYSGYRVDALADEAIRFIQHKRSKPFFLFVSFVEPHHQNDMHAFVAPNGYAEKYSNPFVPHDLRPFPGDWYKSLPDYYGIIARLDECLGRILSVLNELAISDETIIVFTSDHGCHFRSRNSEYKRSCHEGSIKIPMIIRGPGFSGGKEIPELVSLVNLPVTLLDAAGIPVSAVVQGKSAMPLTRGQNTAWKNEVYVQLHEVQLGRALRTERWKYCVYNPDEKSRKFTSSDKYVEHHLYDLHADPYEMVNLVGRGGEYRKVTDMLKDKLISHIVANGEPVPRIENARYYA